jgi:hypothetical protein
MEGRGGLQPLLPDRFLTLHIIFDFKTSFSKNRPFVNKKACFGDSGHIYVLHEALATLN